MLIPCPNSLSHTTLLLAVLLVLPACDGTTETDSLAEGLVGHYSFDADASDSGPNGRDGTLLGNATTNGALVTGNNAADALSLPSSIVNGLQDFTFAGWVRLDQLHVFPSQWVSCANSSDDNNLGIWYDHNNDAWSIDILGSRLRFGANTAMEDGQWHHVVVTRSGTTAALYVDKMSVPPSLTVPVAALSVDSGGFIVGQDQDSVGGGFAADNSLAGAVDDFRVYNRALSDAEVTALYNLGRTP